MELVNTNDESPFDPTPKLKSSPIPINFISFNGNDDNCIHCGENYVMTYYYNQKFYKKCLSSYLTNITDNNIYLDVYIFTIHLECSKHEISKETNHKILDILYFKQIPPIRSITWYYMSIITKDSLYDNMIESEKQCKLCGKSLSQRTNDSDFQIVLRLLFNFLWMYRINLD
jgi:hypothetical protein